MEHNEVKTTLLNSGLSNWEVEAYLILIRYGPKTAVELSRLSKVARSKTYEVITRLRRKGLVMKVPPMPTKGVTQKFVAINPKEVFSTRIDELSEATKYLYNAYNNPKEARYPKINFYTTKENAKKFLIKISNQQSGMHIFLLNGTIKRLMGYSFDIWIKALNKKKNYFILSNEYEYLIKELKKSFVYDKMNGINYIITKESLILDLWETQHIILEIQSKEAAMTFLRSFLFKYKLK